MGRAKGGQQRVAVTRRAQQEYSTSELLKIERFMYPGKDNASIGGFLAPGERLAEVIETDSTLLEEIGVTHEELVERFMKEIDTPWNRARGYGVQENEDFIVRFGARGHKGFQDCPYSCVEEDHNCRLDAHGYSRYYNALGFEITSKKHRKTSRSYLKVALPEQAAHLIHDHHFFEGHTRYRIDPELLAQVLNLGKFRV